MRTTVTLDSDESVLRTWPAAVSPLVADAVIGAVAQRRVLGVFPTCVYIELGRHDAVLALLTRDAVRLPIGLHLTALAGEIPWGVEPGDVVLVGGGRVRIAQHEVDAVRVAKLPRVRPRATQLGPAAYQPVVPVRQTRLVDAIRTITTAALSGHPIDAGVGALVGRGAGLTPSGDDALCGLLLALGCVAGEVAGAAHRSVAAAVGAHLTSTTSLSGALLAAAGQGYAADDVVRLALLLTGPAPTPVEREVNEALARVLAIGHTSGADVVAGLVGASTALREHVIDGPGAVSA